jgi:hypothetical protein
MYLSAAAMDILETCDCGEYGCCVLNTMQGPLAEALAHAELLERDKRLRHAFRTTARGKKRLAAARKQARTIDSPEER